MKVEKPRRGARRLLLFFVLVGAFATTLAAAPSAYALFPPIDFFDESTLNINLAGTGGGQVNFEDNTSPTPVILTCTPTCTEEYSWFKFTFPVVPKTPTLTAIAAAGSTFTGWTVDPAGAIVIGCGLSITCEVNMGFDNPITATANFAPAPNTFPLAVLKAGTGQGTVTSAPAGIDCGADCGESYAQGSVVTLTATPAAGSTFTGWSGACTGTGNCVVTMNAAQSVTATFDTQTFPLTVTLSGTGTGGVASSPAGIACPGTCTADFPQGTVVTLTAQAAPGSLFQGWTGGGCAATGTCVVTMSAAQAVTATFVAAQVQASVVRTTIRKTGPPRAIRQLRVTVDAQEDLARIVLRVRRNGVTLQSRTIRNFAADTAVIRMNLRNGIRAGGAQLQVGFVSEAGTQKIQNRGIRIPRL